MSSASALQCADGTTFDHCMTNVLIMGPARTRSRTKPPAPGPLGYHQTQLHCKNRCHELPEPSWMRAPPRHAVI